MGLVFPRLLWALLHDYFSNVDASSAKPWTLRVIFPSEHFLIADARR